MRRGIAIGGSVDVSGYNPSRARHRSSRPPIQLPVPGRSRSLIPKLGRLSAHTFVLSCLAAAASAQPAAGQRNVPREFRASRASFDNIDYTNLSLLARRRRPQLSPENARRLVEGNVQFIFFNLLNRRSFLVTPTPRNMVSKIESILEVDAKRSKLISSGVRLSREEPTKKEMKHFIRDLIKLSKNLQRQFETYFRDNVDSTLTLGHYRMDSAPGEFAHYVRQCEELSQLLTARLDQYFFNAAPAEIDVAVYGSHSIVVLCQSIQRLSKRVEESLDRR